MILYTAIKGRENMKKNDEQIVMNLINQYGLDEIYETLNLNKEFIDHMIAVNSYDFNTPTLFCETENGQIFSNGKTTLFYLNKKVFNPTILNYSKLDKRREVIVVKPEYFDQYLEKIKQYKGSWHTQKDVTVNTPFTTVYTNDDEQFSKNAYKLLKMLLKNPKIYISSSHVPVMFAENEHGKAYILGKTKEGQYILK